MPILNVPETQPANEEQAGTGEAARRGRRTKVLVLCPYPRGSVPGQRFRYEQYLDALRHEGIDLDIESFLDERAMRILYIPSNYVAKVLGVLSGFWRRVGALRRAGHYDFVFIHREASPLGPPIIEWALFIMGCRVIFDFDDAIFVPQQSKANPFMRYLRCAWKTSYTVSRAHLVSVCNPYLVEWARSRNPRVALIATTVDETYHKPPEAARRDRRLPVIGWTGSHSTAKFLEIVRPALVELQKRHEFEFRVICDHDPGCPELTHYRFVRWQLETEVEDLAAFDIGIMPVPEGRWERGKVGFKAIQYSALAMPSVVSSVGSGREVVVDGETGFVVENDIESWTRALERLLVDLGLARDMGRKARTHILERYSVSANIANYVRLFSLDT